MPTSLGARAERIYSRLLAKPGWLLLLMLALLAAAATQWSSVRFDASSETLVVEGDTLFAHYRAFRETFADDDFILVAARPRADALASSNGLALIARIQTDLGSVTGVASTLSLLDVPILPQGRAATLRDPDTDVDKAMNFLRRQPLFAQQLISTDGQIASIRVALPPRGSHSETLNHIRETLAIHSDSVDLYLGGVPLIAHDMVAFVRDDVRTFALGIAVLMLLALVWFFRRLRWVALNLIPAAAACSIGAGLLGLLDLPMSVISANAVSLLAIFCISFSIHLVVRYRELLSAQPDLSHREMVTITMASKLAPCVFTALTTMVAFVSLTTSGIPPVVDFGWMMAIGVGLGLLVTYWLFPALLLLLPRGKPSSTLGKPIAAVNALAATALRKPGMVTVAAAAVSALALVGMSQITIGGTFSSYFRGGTDVREGLELIDEQIGGVLPLNVVIDLQLPKIEPDDPFADPDSTSFTRGLDDATLASLGRLTLALRDRADIGSVTSLADVVELIATAAPTVRTDAFARSLALNALAERFQGSLIRPYISPDGDQLRLSLRMRETASPSRYPEVVSDIRALAVSAGFRSDDVTATGMYMLYGDSLRVLFDSQRSTVLAVLLATATMIVLLLRSLKHAALGVVTNCLGAMVILGFMGWVGITLDMMTITIAAITIGIGVDDAIHYLHRFQAEMVQNGDDAAGAINSCHASVGRAAYFTSCVVALGFIVLLLSRFTPTATFGLLTAVAMAVAFVANLLLLPSLLMLIHRSSGAQQGS